MRTEKQPSVEAQDTMDVHNMIVLVIILLLHPSSGFWITLVEPSLILVTPGTTVTLSCTVDGHYEWCKFYHPNGKFCDFEWKRSQKNITMQDCNLQDRVAFHGAYDDKQCGVTFTATEQDTGEWRCELEEYVTGWARGAGRIQTALINVTVHIPTTPTVETTTPILKTTLSSVKNKTSSTTTTTVSYETKESVKTLNSKNPDEASKSVQQVGVNSTGKAGSSSSVLIAVFSAIIVILLAVSGGIYYRRRKNSSNAAVVYDREAKMNHDRTNMVRDSTYNITFHSNKGDNRNLHEYYPPNLTYSTTTPELQA